MEITVNALAAMRAAGEAVTVLDVREAHEVAICSLAGAVHIPMGEVPGRVGELAEDGVLVVMCHHGARSMRVVQFLRGRGRQNVVNLAGGIDAWAVEIEPGMARY